MNDVKTNAVESNRRRGQRACDSGAPPGAGTARVGGGRQARKQSSLSGKESAQGRIPKRLLGRPD